MKDITTNGYGALFLVLVCFGLIAFVGDSDYKESEAQSANYCDKVGKGLWPDFEGTYKSYCKKEAKINKNNAKKA